MSALLTEIPWWLMFGLVLAGAVMLTHGNRRANPRLRTAGLLVVSLAFLLGAAHFLIDTDAERCQRRTVQIVKDAGDQNWAALQNSMDPDTEIDLSKEWPPAKGPADIRKAAEAIAKQVGLHSVIIVSSHTDSTNPGVIAVTFSAASLQDTTLDRAFSSGWEFDYRPVNGQWHLRLIKLLSLGDQTM